MSRSAPAVRISPRAFLRSSAAPVENWSRRMSPRHRVVGHCGADHRDVAVLARGAGTDRDLDRRAGFAADPADDIADRVSGGRLAIDGDDLVAGHQPGLLGWAIGEDRHDERQAVGRCADPDADPDEGARQVLGTGGPLLGGHERRVSGVADRLGHAIDRAVDEGLVVELIGADVLAMQDVPGLAYQPEVRRRRATVGSRGRRSGIARDGRCEASDPDPDAERQHQGEPDRRATDLRPASSTGRR